MAGLALSLAAALGSVVALWSDQAVAKTRSTALPPGWEMCVLQGVGASVTASNVADLDAWQQAEGGGSANPEAFNPFNTRRGTDQSDASLPASWTSGGFPSFRSWAAGCAATVATILQSNMTAIATALNQGDVSPPEAFLATVDQTPWCAPSDGVPCYSGQITGGAALDASSALGLYHDATTTLAAYNQSKAKLAGANAQLAAAQDRLTVADITLRLAHYGLERATQALRKFAISDYTSNPSLEKMASAMQYKAPSQSDMLAQYYTSLGSGIEVRRFKAAQAVLDRTGLARDGAAATVAQDQSAAKAAQSEVSGSVGRLDITLVSLHTAGACTDAVAGGPPATGSEPPVVATVRGCLASLGGA